MPFQTAYVPVNIAPDGTYVLTAAVVYEGRDDTFTVPAGFTTDLASVPRLMCWLVPIAGIGDRAAVVHDWLCTELEADRARWSKPGGLTVSEHMAGAPIWPPASARDTDGIFRRILRELGVPLVRRWLMWTGVRWGALFNPARRAGWWRDAPKVLAISIPAALILSVPALFVGLALLIDGVVERVR